MTLETIEIQTADDPGASIIVLHGLGADGNDFVPVCQALELTSLGGVRFVLPHAPVRPVTVNGGYAMRAWYDIFGADLLQREDEPGLRASMKEVEALIAREKERGIAARRIVLAGFSQGCALTLLAGLRHGERLAGLAGLSGYLPLAAQTQAERSPNNCNTPVFLAHGRSDPVVSLSRALATRETLQALGQPLEWHEYDMPHAVCAAEIADLNGWLLRVLAP